MAPDRFEFEAPLHRPGVYDDIEVPGLFRLKERYFLIGSIREDTKIQYWDADAIAGPYENFYDNVLLPAGNCAGRICRAGDKVLLFSFFSRKEIVCGREVITRLLPPPKELTMGAHGRLVPRSYSGFDALTTNGVTLTDPSDFQPLFGNPNARAAQGEDAIHLSCPSGFEAFLLPGEHEDFRLRATVRLVGLCKCGLVLRVSPEGDGYFLSPDLVKGVVELRHWGASPLAEFEHAFRYEVLQDGAFLTTFDRTDWTVEVVTHGTYLELSINGQIPLSLVDDGFQQGRA